MSPGTIIVPFDNPTLTVILAILMVAGIPLTGIYLLIAKLRRWSWPRRARRVELGLVCAAAVAAFVPVFIVPKGMYQSITEAFGPDGQVRVIASVPPSQETRLTIVSLIFVVLALIPFIAWKRPARNFLEWLSALLLGSLSTISGFSIGGFFLPATALMVVATVAGLPAARRTDVSEQPP